MLLSITNLYSCSNLLLPWWSLSSFLSIIKSAILKFPIIICYVSTYPLIFVNFCSKYFVALLLGEFMSKTVMFSERIYPFIFVNCHSFFVITVFILKCILFDITIATLALFRELNKWYIYSFHYFTFSLFLSLKEKIFSFWQHMIWSSFSSFIFNPFW